MTLSDNAEKLAIAAAAVKQQIDQAAAKGAEELSTAIESAKQSGEEAQERLSAAVGETVSTWQSEIAALGASGMATANALKDLPRTAQALA